MAADNGNDDWSSVRFRPRRVGANASPEDAAQTRFLHGAILFVAVALAYPWYSYWVQSRLLAADAARAMNSLDAEIHAVSQRSNAAIDEAATIEPLMHTRPVSPRILGVSEGASTPVIVADLEGASLVQAERRLCSEATRWTRRPSTGRTFRVQRYRGSDPAVSVGSIQC